MTTCTEADDAAAAAAEETVAFEVFEDKQVTTASAVARDAIALRRVSDTDPLVSVSEPPLKFPTLLDQLRWGGGSVVYFQR